MNTPNPLVPEGSLTKETKGKTNVRIAVFTILAVHVVLLGGLLMQGCKPEGKKEAKETLTPTNSLPPLDTTYYSGTNPPPETNFGSVAQTPQTVPLETIPPAPAPAPTLNTTEYTVAKGDNYSKIAKAKGVSVRMLADADP